MILVLISFQVQDKLQAACFGRPSFIKPIEFDVRQLELEDCELANDQAQVFLQQTRLTTIIARMLELQTQRPENSFDDVCLSSRVLPVSDLSQ
jgi:hypothetical protein